MNLQTDVNLQSLNTLAVPAVAEFFVECSTIDEIKAALNWAHENQKTTRILAGGSNVILAAKLPGLTIVPKLLEFSVLQEDDANVVIQIGAGENWHSTVMRCVNQGWYGLENLALIPGSVGAAPIQNIGAYGVEIKDFIEQVSVLDTRTFVKRLLNNEECKFAYRESLFKEKEEGRYIVCNICIKLSKTASPVVSYPALREYLQENALAQTPENVMNAVIAIRQSKLPDPVLLPNAGSFFKNPHITNLQFNELKKNHETMPGFTQQDGSIKLAAAWLIEQCGWKGKELNGVEVHKDHALVIVNPNKKSARDVLTLADNICKDVKAKFNVDLEQEPRILL